MIKRSDIYADLHVHTLFSLHAYSTLKECIDAAASQGLRFLAVTDHFYADGTVLNQKNEVTRLTHFANRVNKNAASVQIVSGAEFNVAHNIPVWEKLRKLRWKLFGLHAWFIDREEITLDELKRHYIKDGVKYNAWAHIERELHKIDHGRFGREITNEVKNYLDYLVVLAKERGICLEVNETSLIDDDGGARARMRHWLQTARDNGNVISLGTDAHYCEEIGCFDYALEILNELDYPKEKILNCNCDALHKLTFTEE